jgi:hypothetical protein
MTASQPAGEAESESCDRQQQQKMHSNHKKNKTGDFS